MMVALQIDARSSHRSALMAACAGNFIEWFEFGVYGFLATIIAGNFFKIENTSAATSLILTYASFALAFFFRPLGAFVFGKIGDRIGRRPTLITVVITMTVATAAIGLMPTYPTIGIAAPLLLTLLRVLQGLSAGGEFGGAVSLMTELAPSGKRGFYGAWQSLTVALGLLCAAAVVALLDAMLGAESMQAWAWRIPFLLALPLGAIALRLRLYIEETPTFMRARAEPVRHVASLRDTVKAIGIGIGRLMGWSAAGYTFLVIMPAYLQTALHNSFETTILIAVLSNLGFALTILPAGAVSDRIGRRAVLMTGIALIIVLTFPLLKILQNEAAPFWLKGVSVLVAGGAVGLLAGPGPAMLAEMFPTRFRYTGLGLAYSLSNALFSGSAGLIITSLIKETGNNDIPGYYVLATALVSLFALASLGSESHRISLDDETNRKAIRPWRP